MSLRTSAVAGLCLLAVTTSLLPEVSAKTSGPIESCVKPFPSQGYGQNMGVIHTCGPRHRAKLWGPNLYGGLGIESSIIGVGANGQPFTVGPHLEWIKGMESRSIITGCSGAHYNCVLTGADSSATEGDVYCWGYNTYGNLGQGNTTNLGSQPGSMTNLKKVELGGTVNKLSCEYHTACVVMSGTKEIKCWGGNMYGGAGIDSSETAIGDEADEMGGFLEAVKLSEDFTDVSVFMQACGLTEQKSVFCWGGTGADGVLGNPTLSNTIGKNPGEMAQLNALPIDFGLTPSQYVISVHTGMGYSCVLVGQTGVTLQRAKCWGINDFGQLGLGDNSTRGDNAYPMGTSFGFINTGGKSVTQISCGPSHMCLLLADGTMLCFGDNFTGALGIESQVYQGMTPDTVGAGAVAVKLNKISGVATIYRATMVTAGPFHYVYAFGDNSIGQLGRNDTTEVGAVANDLTFLQPYDLGFCTAKNFVIVSDDRLLNSSQANQSYYYTITNPLDFQRIKVKFQGNGFNISSPDFNKTHIIGAGQSLSVRVYLGDLAVEMQNTSASIQGWYSCEYDDEVQYALPVHYATLYLGGLTQAPTSDAVMNGLTASFVTVAAALFAFVV